MSSISLLLLTIGATFVSAFPTPVSNSTATAVSEVVCGTAGGATLSACQSVLDNWSGQSASAATCSGGAYTVASVPGCSIYATSASQDPADLKAIIESIMSCADEQHGTVNGIAELEDGTRVCVGGDAECGSCVEHLEDGVPSQERRSLEAREVTASEFRVATKIVMGDITRWQRANTDTWKKEYRTHFTTTLVSGLLRHFPSMNAVVCHTKHSVAFDGTKGVDWFHQNIQIDKWPMGTYGYELYLFKSGTFELYGDGGFENWAWNGVVHKKAMNGAYLEFKDRT